MTVASLHPQATAAISAPPLRPRRPHSIRFRTLRAAPSGTRYFLIRQTRGQPLSSKHRQLHAQLISKWSAYTSCSLSSLLHAGHSPPRGFQTVVDAALESPASALSNAISTSIWKPRGGEWPACNSELSNMQDLSLDQSGRLFSHMAPSRRGGLVWSHRQTLRLPFGTGTRRCRPPLPPLLRPASAHSSDAGGRARRINVKR